MLTLEKKVGQMLNVGWPSDNVNDIIENIKKYNFGNIILFTRNIRDREQVAVMCKKIQEAALEYNGIPAFISTDQEGGSVRRIYKGVTKTPGAMAIAAACAKYPDAAKIIGDIISAELKDAGINMNLAPVADINSNPFNPVIAIRSFSDDAQTVARLAADFSAAQQKNGVLSCYKHFLGHGAVSVDSHVDLPRLDKTIEELRAFELVPYAVSGIADAVMTAHILYEKVDEQLPASISEKILKDILRGELNYKGLIVTDCFEMEGLMRTFSFEEAAMFAAKATCDMITVSHTFGRQLKVRNTLISAVKSGCLSEEIIDNAYERIVRYKNIYCKPAQQSQPDYAGNQKIAEHISRASITIASGRPMEIDSDTVVVGVTNYLNAIVEDANVEKMDIARRLSQEFGIRYKSIDNKNFNLNEILSFVNGSKVILALSDSHLTLVQKVLYSSMIQNARELMLISLRTPYDVLGQDLPVCHICLYEYTELSINSLICVLRGGEAYGTLPVRLNFNSGKEAKKNLAEHAVDYMKKNFGKRLTLDVVADEFLITGGHLCKLFKRKLNRNFMDVLNEIRISEAKNLLNTTHLKIYEVANLCGFSDVNYFSRLFRSYVGMTPTYYKRNVNIYD